MRDEPRIRIEMFGIPRLRAGRGECEVVASTVGQALRGLAVICPGLSGSVLVEGERIAPSYRLSLNGDRFLTDPLTPLKVGDALILLSADVGG